MAARDAALRDPDATLARLRRRAARPRTLQEAVKRIEQLEQEVAALRALTQPSNRPE